jgi:hypothetical protein
LGETGKIEMSGVTRKSQAETLDGTPEKRMFWSIANDYGLETGICELVDNALDQWILGGRKFDLSISINLDVQRQLISVQDNAGGVKQEELRLLITPGGSRNNPQDEVIGIFGVGSKRAAIALGEQVEIRTRYREEQAFQIDILPEWIVSPDWEIPSYKIPNIRTGSTHVDISRLRNPLTENDVDTLRLHLGETYDWFLSEGCEILLNDEAIAGRSFNDWAYPPGFSPNRTFFEIELPGAGRLKVTIVAGLIRDRVPELDNYGVYFYCNHRLIEKEVRNRAVGYGVSSEAGVPHPDASLCRAIVNLHGPARAMPWNSSKNAINFEHLAYRQMRLILIQLVTQFTRLSRRLKQNWNDQVFRYDSGEFQEIPAPQIVSAQRLILPELPRKPRTSAANLKRINEIQLAQKSWLLGIVEAMEAVEILDSKPLETKNRITLILLDCTFEIALKEFIVHRTDLFPPNGFRDKDLIDLFSSRERVIRTVVEKRPDLQSQVDQTRHFYNLRNKLIHERASMVPTDKEISNYRMLVERILTGLFDLQFPK